MMRIKVQICDAEGAARLYVIGYMQMCVDKATPSQQYANLRVWPQHLICLLHQAYMRVCPASVVVNYICDADARVFRQTHVVPIYAIWRVKRNYYGCCRLYICDMRVWFSGARLSKEICWNTKNVCLQVLLSGYAAAYERSVIKKNWCQLLRALWVCVLRYCRRL